jgi:uncharacterized protein YaiI (UPF0178 family)
MKLLVDADACPVVDPCVNAARRRGLRGPKKREREDDRAFAQALDTLLDEG